MIRHAPAISPVADRSSESRPARDLSGPETARWSAHQSRRLKVGGRLRDSLTHPDRDRVACARTCGRRNPAGCRCRRRRCGRSCRYDVAGAAFAEADVAAQPLLQLPRQYRAVSVLNPRPHVGTQAGVFA